METTLRFDDELHRAAKAEAARRGMSLSSLIEHALRETIGKVPATGTEQLAEIQEREQLLDSLLKSSQHFRIGPRPTREEMNER